MILDPAHPGVSNVISHIVAVLNNTQGLYEYNENINFTNGIEFDINEIVVSTCLLCDPITDSKIASSVLSNFSEWVINGGFTKEVQAAQFWTDRTFSNSIIGLSLQSKNLFCESKAHSIIRDYTTTAGLLRTLVAHEIAHNFNGVHDNSSGQILSPTVTATSTWSDASKQSISNEIQTQSACLTPCDNFICQNIFNLNVSEIGSNSFKVSWSAVSNNQNYKITLKIAALRQSSLTLSHLSNHTSYLHMAIRYANNTKYQCFLFALITNQVF
ncbi:MAG: hypothetical protein IPO48_06425 [Saprospiraceae bacterium]|nr:hypothetical protein [Saprospiraceae bacterium]